MTMPYEGKVEDKQKKRKQRNRYKEIKLYRHKRITIYVWEDIRIYRNI